jgi:hypothetical protein
MTVLLLPPLAPARGATPPTGPVRAQPLTLHSPTQLDAYFLTTLKHTQKSFDWNQAPLDVLWSGLRHSGGLLLLGYKPARLSVEQLENDVTLLEQAPADWQAAYQQVLALIGSQEQAATPALVSHHPDLRYCWVRVENAQTLQALKASPLVRYMAITYQPAVLKPLLTEPAPEPAAQATFDLPQSIGCGPYGPLTPKFVQDNEMAANVGGILIPWNYRFHNIQATWDNEGATGKGIGLFMFDTGLNPSSTMVKQFNNGVFKNRTLLNLTGGDGCGHGTGLAGVLAGPRVPGAMVGVAYEADLVATGRTRDVIIDTQDEIERIVNAFKYVASGDNFPNKRKIISMSLGGVGLTGFTNIEDAIKLAYKAGILIFSAAGTSPWIVSGLSSPVGGGGPLGLGNEALSKLVFPANYTYRETVNGQPQTIDPIIGVSGLRSEFKEDFVLPSIKVGKTTRCESCVLGSTVDFVIVMEKPRKNPVGKAKYVQSLSWPFSETSTYPTNIGGSSIATATMAGIAALVWSKDPSRSREQVVKALRMTSYYETRIRNIPLTGGVEFVFERFQGRQHKFYGSGLPDALAAIEYLEKNPLPK